MRSVGLLTRSSSSSRILFPMFLFALLRLGPPNILHRYQKLCLFVRHSSTLVFCAAYPRDGATGVSFGGTPLAGRLVRSEPPPVLRLVLPSVPAPCSYSACPRVPPEDDVANRVVAGAKGPGLVAQPPRPNCCATNTIAAHWWPESSLYKIHQPFQERPSYACFEMSLFLSV